MDPSVSTSFIPKRPLTDGGRKRPTGSGLFFLLSVLIFIASLTAAGAVFAYTQFLESSIVYKKDSLAKAQSAYDPAAIEELIRLDDKIVESRGILASHVAPTGLFAFLSTQTLEQVRFGEFSLTMSEDGGAELELKGEADNFSTVALQSDQFGASKMLKDIIFSELVVGETTGKVTFTISAKVDAPLLLYKESSNPAPASIPEAPAAPVESVTSTPI